MTKLTSLFFLYLYKTKKNHTPKGVVRNSETVY